MNDYHKLIKKIESKFEDIPFKKQNDFTISIVFDPMKYHHTLNINFKIYNGTLIEDYYDKSKLIPCPQQFMEAVKLIERFDAEIKGYSIEQYLRDLDEFIKKTKEKANIALKLDKPYEDIIKTIVKN